MPIPILPACHLHPDPAATVEGLPNIKGYRVLAPLRPGQAEELVGYVYLDKKYHCWRHRLPAQREIRGSDGSPTLAAHSLMRLALQHKLIEVEYV
jgi:hypothetical protein